MTKRRAVRQSFVESFPQPLEDGVVYVSIPFATVAHLCCCGCGSQVITELSPRGWRLTFDGETVSLFPSIGNWSFACQSHYWISRNRVEWASRWSERRIRNAREEQARELAEPPQSSAQDGSKSPSTRRRRKHATGD